MPIVEAIIAKYWQYIALAGMVAALWVANIRIENLHADLDKAHSAISAYQQYVADEKTARATEQQQASKSYADLQTSCQANVAQAVNRGRVIERVVTAPPRADGTRGLVASDSLRSIMGQAAGPEGGASSLPAGSHGPGK